MNPPGSRCRSGGGAAAQAQLPAVKLPTDAVASLPVPAQRNVVGLVRTYEPGDVMTARKVSSAPTVATHGSATAGTFSQRSSALALWETKAELP